MRVGVILGGLGLVLAAGAWAGAADPDGKALYQAKCTLCHGDDGKGRIKAPHLPDFSSADWQKQATDAFIKDVLAKGKPGTMMRSFQKELTAAEVEAVVAYLRKLGTAAK